MGAFLDGDWESLCKLFTVDESPHLSSNFLEYSSSPISFQDDNLKFPFLSHNVNDNNSSYSSSLNDWMSSNPTNSYNCGADSLLSSDILSCIDFSMANSDNDALSLPPSTNIVHNHNHNYNHDHNNFGSVDKLSSPNTELCLKRKLDESDELLEETTKKNARISKDAMKKKRKVNQNADEETTPTVNTKESKETADSNSDDTNNPCASEENAETADSNSNLAVSLSSTVKKRANRGAATDPQSLYARKRRMRINERLKVLQNLVPNGTKVDISTMLEEAFHYVKFLQLQIRLLSSDDLWMYAPLAYNGFDVGAYRKMPPFHGL